MRMRLSVLLALLALLAAPFGRMAAAETALMPHHGGMAAAASGHCDDMPQPEEGTADRAIDCLIACAAATPPEAAAVPAGGFAAAAPEAAAPRHFAGITPEAEPPPPRFS